jgi:hypothetical protein
MDELHRICEFVYEFGGFDCILGAHHLFFSFLFYFEGLGWLNMGFATYCR